MPKTDHKIAFVDISNNTKEGEINI